jgi:hypothetical protein
MNMKRKILLLAMAMLCFAFFTGPVSAYTLMATGYKGTYGNLDGFGPYLYSQDGITAGEISMQAGDGLAWVTNYYVDGKTKGVAKDASGAVIPNTFQSFCLEKYVGLWTGTAYQATLSYKTDDYPEDNLSIGVAWLYSNFVKKTLTGYNYDGGEQLREQSAKALQYAIWYLENEVSGDEYKNNIFVKAAKTQFDGLTNARANSNGAYGIKVANLTSGGTMYQSVLVATPIPAAAWLLGTGLLGLVSVRRRMTV